MEGLEEATCPSCSLVVKVIYNKVRVINNWLIIVKFSLLKQLKVIGKRESSQFPLVLHFLNLLQYSYWDVVAKAYILVMIS